MLGFFITGKDKHRY